MLKRLLVGTALLTFVNSANAADIIEPMGALEPDVYTGLIFTGIFDLYGGYSWYTNSDGNANGIEETDSALIGGAARVSVPWSANFSTQFDLESSGVLGSYGSDEDQYSSSVVAAVHASFRQPENYLVGLFGGGGLAIAADEETGNLWFAGVEGQAYLGDFTLYGQAGYLDSIEADGDDSDTFHNAYFARAAGRYFFTPNSMLQGEVSYARGKQDTGGGYDMNIWGWGARYEQGLETMPISLFVAYEGAHYDNGSGGDTGSFIEHTGLVGAKFRFGPNSLKENDRLGATLDLPRFGRWVASGDAVD
jgi:hypothetical protein